MKIKFTGQSLIDLGRLGIENLEVSKNHLVISRLSGLIQYNRMDDGRRRVTTGPWTSHELGILDEVWNDISR